MRDLTQFWGWRGGGATSWDHRERERSVLKIAAESGIGSTGGRELRLSYEGKRVFKVSWRELRSSEVDLKVLKSMIGGWCSC